MEHTTDVEVWNGSQGKAIPGMMWLIDATPHHTTKGSEKAGEMWDESKRTVWSGKTPQGHLS